VHVLRALKRPRHVDVYRRAGAEEQRSRRTDVELLLRRGVRNQEVARYRNMAFDLRRNVHHDAGGGEVGEVNGHVFAVSRDRGHVVC